MSVNITLGTDPTVNETKEYLVTDFGKPYSKRVGISQSQTFFLPNFLGNRQEDVEDWNGNLLNMKVKMAQRCRHMHQHSPALLHIGLIPSSE